MKETKAFSFILAAAVTVSLSSCLDKGDETINLGSPENLVADIPSDNDADPNPIIGETTTNIPNIQYSVVEEDGSAVMRIDMTGVQGNSLGDWLRLLGTNEPGQNVWVEVDGQSKGIRVYNTSDNQGQRVLPVDIVFLVDNSGSMSEEADVLARDITDWAQSLERSQLDVRFGCVGYDGEITGEVDVTSYSTLAGWLNRTGYPGTNRTVGFNEIYLQNYASAYRTGGSSSNECGMAALWFAADHFSWRKNASRVFVNFTDEPNQPAGIERFSVESLLSDWDTSLGTIHTVFSGGKENSREYNYLMSQYTGGTVINTDGKFTGVTLSSLPVTGALQNSYVIRFTNIEDLFDGLPHEVKITIVSTDGAVMAERIFYIVFVKE